MTHAALSIAAVAPLALFAAVPVANAQEKGTFIIDVFGGPVSPSNPSVTVKIFASFPQKYFAFGTTGFNVASSDLTGEFSNMTKPTGPGALSASGFCTPWNGGIPDGAGGVASFSVSQLNVLGCGPNPFNPIQIWEATWTTSNFAPREVVLTTANVGTYKVYTNSQSSVPDLLINHEPASAVFQVVPAPGGAILLAATIGLAAGRRR